MELNGIGKTFYSAFLPPELLKKWFNQALHILKKSLTKKGAITKLYSIIKQTDFEPFYQNYLDVLHRGVNSEHFFNSLGKSRKRSVFSEYFKEQYPQVLTLYVLESAKTFIEVPYKSLLQRYLRGQNLDLFFQDLPN